MTGPDHTPGRRVTTRNPPPREGGVMKKMRLATTLAATVAAGVLTAAPAVADDLPPRDPHGGPSCADRAELADARIGMEVLEVEDGVFDGYHGWRDALVAPGHWGGRWVGRHGRFEFLQKAYRLCAPDGTLDETEWATVRYRRPAGADRPWASVRVTRYPFSIA